MNQNELASYHFNNYYGESDSKIHEKYWISILSCDDVLDLKEAYKENKVNSNVHHGNLSKVRNFIRKKKEIFADGSYAFNFSTVQKYFNMMCKYYWCAGFIKEPPELPIDSINVSKIGKNYSWTREIIEISHYKKKIEEFRSNECVLSESSLAVWELKNWERRQFNGQKNEGGLMDVIRCDEKE